MVNDLELSKGIKASALFSWLDSSWPDTAQLQNSRISKLRYR